jgi:hypothetical protein
MCREFQPSRCVECRICLPNCDHTFLTAGEFQGAITNQAYCESGAMSPEYYEAN